ncbi:MAG TPA: aminotransferase class I/II-fold pyridoxal phosphate-dependent enzyme [Candidatus Magasanikbacteria bacterium]|nr:aminotransferase class I/II-fold pyridoxal phosphate-dependent enzyme [Candidatus Magasanikbacteria bacterium]
MSFTIPESPTIRINALVQKLKAEGKVVYNLSVGEPVIATPQIIRDAARRAIDEDKTSYPPAAGIPELRSAVASWISESHGCSYTADQIVITPGGKSALYFLLQTILEKNDEVLVIAPYWVTYPAVISIFGGVPKIVETEPQAHWKVTVDALEAAYSTQTKILILNNASNPTGILYTRDELCAILTWAKEKGIVVISDEVYSGLVYEGEFVSCGSFKEFEDNVYVVQSASKNFGMTGWRIGILAGNSEVLKKVTAVLSQSVSGVTTISQWALLEGLRHKAEICSLINQEFKTRKDSCVRLIRELFRTEIEVPASGLYVFLPLTVFGSTNETSVEWTERILKEAGVATVPGSAFGMEGYVRLSFGGKIEETEAGLRALLVYFKSDFTDKALL